MTADNSGQSRHGLQIVRQYVRGEATSSRSGFSSVESPVEEARAPEDFLGTVEPSLTEETLPDETTQGDGVVPRPTVYQQPFSAPPTEWDPIQ